MFQRLTILCWGLIIVIMPVVAAISWIATKDTNVFIMVPSTLLFVGAPWFVFWFIRLIITGCWK
jgi:hypothetical protein